MGKKQGFRLRWPTLTVAMLCLHGCADPIDLVMYGMQAADTTPAYEPPPVTASPVSPEYMKIYRDYDCTRLREMYEGYQKPEYKALMAYHADAMVQISAEKGCPKVGDATAAQSAVSATTASPQVATLVAPPSNEAGFGIEVETLSTSVATAVGLSPAEGALIIAVPKGSTGQKAGLKAMDVILEVSGQSVSDTASLQAIVKAMRVGYKAPVRVWRERAMKDLVVEVKAQSNALSNHTPPVAPAAPQPTPAPAAVAASTVGSGWGSTSSVSGLPQTSLAEWIAMETPAKYQGKSCDYLRQAYLSSEEMIAANPSSEAKAWGTSKKTAISQVLEPRNCPPLVTVGRGRIGVMIGGMDPIKAQRLGMPLKGASVEKVIPGGPAEKAGMAFADVVVSVDATPIGDDIDFRLAVGKVPVGTIAQLKVWRKGAYIDIRVTVGPST